MEDIARKYRLDDLSKLVNEIENDVSSIVESGLKIQQDFLSLLVFMLSKCLLTSRAIIILCLNGLPDDALALARNAFEQLVTLLFLESKRSEKDYEEYIEDYYTDYEYQLNKALKWVAERILENKNEVERLNNEKKQLTESGHQKTMRGNYWWTGCGTFKSVVEKLINQEKDETFKKILAKLYFVYLRACTALHAGSIGNVLRLGSDPDFDGIDNSPKNTGQENALFLLSASLIGIVGCTCAEFNIKKDYMEKLNNLAVFYEKFLFSKAQYYR